MKTNVMTWNKFTFCVWALAGSASLHCAALGAAPTAHEPQYADKTTWPAKLESDKAAYTRETWPEAPVLVWAGSGSGQGERLPQIKEDGIENPANWRQANGQPATKGPDADTDVIFPADARASIKATFPVRHMTVQKDANVSVNGLDLRGNLWVQKGAKFTFVNGTFGATDKDTYVRSDNDSTERMTNMLRVKKQPDKSLEFMGRWSIGDQVFLQSGQFIVGPGCLFQHTDRFQFDVYPTGTLVILSGATYEARGNYYQKNDLTIRGKLLAGTPDRPLTSDCTIGLSFKAQGKGGDSGSQGVKVSKPDDAGLVVAPDGVLSESSSDPTKARLIFRWHRNPQETHAWGAEKREGKGTGVEPADIAAMEHGIRMRLLGKVQFDGVVFNDVIKGGIQLSDPAVASQWRNVTLGTGNFGKTLDDLISTGTGQ